MTPEVSGVLLESPDNTCQMPSISGAGTAPLRINERSIGNLPVGAESGHGYRKSKSRKGIPKWTNLANVFVL